MAAKKQGLRKQGISKRGSSEDVFDAQMCKEIRKKLGLLKKDLPDGVIRKIIDLNNKEIANWLVNNSEGFKMKDMGVLCVSKHLPKELRENKEESIENINSLNISDLRRKQILSRYNVDIGTRIDFNKATHFQKILPQVNLHTYFYVFKVMWFNKKNCKIKKAPVYNFEASCSLNKMLHDKVVDGKDYYEWNFHDFFSIKIGSKW